MSLEVVATSGAYYINKCLVIRILYCQILSFRLTPIVLNMNLVVASKGYAVVILGKLAGDIQPKQCQFLIVLVFIFIGRTT